ADRVSDRELLLVGGALVDRNLCGPRGPASRLKGERIEALVAPWIDARCYVRRASCRDRLAVLVDQPRLVVAYFPGGIRDIRERLNLRQQRRREGRDVDPVSLAVLEGRLPRDDDVG